MTTLLPAAPPVPAPPPPVPSLRRLRYEPEPGADPCPPVRTAPSPAPAPVVTALPDDPDARRAAAGIVRTALEVLDHRRPPAHLTGSCAASVLRYWRAELDRRRVRAPTRLVRLRFCQPGPAALEATAVCVIDGRVRALAARFERAPGTTRWRCTALRLG